MSSKKWCITFALSVVLVAILYALFNILVDPFGVFGDVIFDWYSYDMTNNPRAAKIGYLDKNKNYEKYDSYIIGCSSTSSFPVEDLNKNLGGSWYNMIMYGADMLDVEQTCKYVVEEYNAKNIMVNIFISNSTKYNVEEDNITKNMHAKLNGENKFNFYTRYMFLNPQYSIAKIKSKMQDTYLQQTFDVFDVETGAYDKKIRDVEPINTINEYYKAYPIFENYPYGYLEMPEIDTTVESIKRIKEYCESKNVNIIFVMAPVYSKYLEYFPQEKVKEYYTKIAEVTDYWDFTTSVFTNEPRYFYDETHFRNALGKMTIEEMAINEKNIIDETNLSGKEKYLVEMDKNILNQVGVYVTKDNVENHIESLWNKNEDTKIYSKKVPIITYHSIVDEPKSNAEISKEMFEEQIKTLAQNNYVGVTFEDLIKYVYEGKELPEKPICITFDDGYLNNYEIAYPILKKYNMKATIFTIGVSIGSLTNYKDTNYPITPHFTYEEAKEMEESGLISIQSHTYDMHQWKEYEENSDGNSYKKIRENLLKLDDETEEEYISDLKNDTKIMQDKIKENLGKDIVALSYPSGMYETLTNVVLKEEGIKATVSINEGPNEILIGLPQTLYALNRYNMDDSVTPSMMLEKIDQ